MKNGSINNSVIATYIHLKFIRGYAFSDIHPSMNKLYRTLSNCFLLATRKEWNFKTRDKGFISISVCEDFIPFHDYYTKIGKKGGGGRVVIGNCHFGAQCAERYKMSEKHGKLYV